MPQLMLTSLLHLSVPPYSTQGLPDTLPANQGMSTDLSRRSLQKAQDKVIQPKRFRDPATLGGKSLPSLGDTLNLVETDDDLPYSQSHSVPPLSSLSLGRGSSCVSASSVRTKPTSEALSGFMSFRLQQLGVPGSSPPGPGSWQVAYGSSHVLCPGPTPRWQASF